MNVTEETCRECRIIMDIFSWYAFFLLICGTVGNLFGSRVCFQIQKQSTFKILGVLFIFETASLYTWNLNIFVKFFMPYKMADQTLSEFNVIESYSLATCKIFTFSQFYSLQCISWLIAFVSIDQAIKLYYPKNFYSLNPRIVYKGCLFIVITLFLVNLHILIFNGKISFTKNNVTEAPNVTAEIEVMDFECYNTNYYEFFPFWDRIHLIIYAFVPFGAIVIFNSLICFKICTIKHREISKRKRVLIITILLTSLLFIVCVLPEIIAFGYYFPVLASTETGVLILYTTDHIHFTFNAFMFLIYYNTNKVFRLECIHRLCSLVRMLRLGFYSCFHKMGCVSKEELAVVKTEFDRNISIIISGTNTRSSQTMRNIADPIPKPNTLTLS